MTALHNPYDGTTPSQRQAAVDRTARLAKFAPPIIAAPIKVAPRLPMANDRYYWHCMWFADVVGIRETKPPGPPKIDFIQRMIAKAYNISTAAMLGERRTDDLVFPRHLAMYLAKALTKNSNKEIGRRFGGRDHTVVMHACRKMNARRVSDREFAALVESFQSELCA